MKNIIKILGLTLISTLFTACNPVQKITVYGENGTKIYTPRLEYLNTIRDGSCQLKMSYDSYVAFLLSKKPGEDLYVPFGLDYKYTSYAGLKAATSILMFTPANYSLIVRVNSDKVYKRYKYLKRHNTNQDFKFIKPVIQTTKREEQPNGHHTETVSANESHSKSEMRPYYASFGNTSSNSVSSKLANSIQKSEKSTIQLSDNAKHVLGTYVGVGKVYQGNEELEVFTDMKIFMDYIDKNTVSVNVYTSDGESFFTTPSIYSVRKISQNKYELTHQSFNAAKIIIEDRQLQYNHPRIEIEKDIYTLKVISSKE